MTKFISAILVLMLASNICLADCDFSVGIKPLPDGGFEYSKECHLKVGQLVQDNATKDQQISDLTKAISLKDLAIKDSDSRVALWEKTSDDEQTRLVKMESDQKMSDWLYFGLGALTVIGTGFALSSLTHR